MRSVAFLSLNVGLGVTLAAATEWPWPWPKPATTVTTTPPPSAVEAFEQGVATALGFDDVSTCFNHSYTGVSDVWIAVEEYNKGGMVSKAKSLSNFAHGIHLVVSALQPCSDLMTDASQYKQLVKFLLDKRYYTAHNGLTLALNIAEDHNQLEAFAEAWKQANYEAAGSVLTSVVLDVLSHPGIPESSGPEAVQIATGIASGFTTDVPLRCITEATVEVPALIGGIIDIAEGVKAVEGLESLFHGLEGLVPTYKQCLSDKKRVMYLLHAVSDFKHPADLAKMVWANMKKNDVNLSLDTSSAILAYKGQEWHHFGLEIGKILGMIIVPADAVVV